MFRFVLIPVSHRLLVLAAALAVVVLALSGGGRVPVASAATLTVTNTGDTNGVCSSNVNCSLREAIAAAAAVDTIDFKQPALSNATIQLASQLLINKNLTITGPSGGITINGGASYRVFEVVPSVTVTLDGITVANGNPAAVGGGILNYGTLDLTNSTVENNTGLDFGGGIFNLGRMTLTDTTVSNNVTNGLNLTGGGGGIYSPGPDLTLIRSTVDNNTTQGRGGGIYNLDDGTLLVNSTVSGNLALNGGGIFNRFGTVSLEFSTTAFNAATDTADGVWNFGNRFTLHNSIVGPNPTSDCTGAIIDFGFNLASDGTCSLSPAIRNNAILDLGLLALNPPGSTRTHALGPLSAAIDGADPSLCPSAPPTDQRGVSRPQPAGGICDVGAYEATCSITVTKQTNPVGGTGFGFSSAFFPGFTLDHGQSQSFSGQHLCGPIYNVFETPQPGWALTNIACVITGGTGYFEIIGSNPNPAFQAGDNQVVFHSLVRGANLQCTFTNTKTACDLEIIKVAPGGGSTQFPFSSAFSGLQGITLVDNQSITKPVLCGPIFNVFETPQPGWALTNIACVITGITGGTGIFSIIGANSNPGFQAGDNEVNFHSLTPGSTLQCTFTNTKTCVAPGGLNIGTGTNGTNGLLSPDPIWKVAGHPAAYGVTPVALTWETPTAPWNWIDPFGTGGSINDPPGNYVYTTSFTVPSGVQSLNLTWSFAGDGVLKISLIDPNNTVIDGPWTPGGVGVLGYSSISISNPVGPYTLKAEVNNGLPSDDPSPTGLLVQGTVTCVLRPVGGVVELLASGSGSPQAQPTDSVPSMPLTASAAAAVATVVALALSGWYVRRRWLE